MTEHEQAVTIIGAAIAAGDMDQVAQHYVNAVATGTEQVMQLVKAARADERKRIRSALLSDDTIRALFTDDVVVPMPNPTATEISETRRSMILALNTIGLTEEEGI